MRIIELSTVDSTNEFCKRADLGNDLIVISEKQTAGKGTKGRSFVSDAGGLYVTVMRHYKNFLAENAFKIMIDACVAVCRTVEKFNLKPVIRWANDVLVNGKKICGTLIENTFSGSYISRSIVGMGLNINNVLPPELKSIATTLGAELEREISYTAVRDELIKNLKKHYTLNDYRAYINWFGKDVILKLADREITATAVDIAEDGGLLCVAAGTVKKISAAEVSLVI